MTLGYALAIIFGLVFLVGMIMLIVKIFEKEEGSKGAIAIILAIFCALALYIWGWVKVREWDAKKAMIIWTIGLVGALIGWGILMGGMATSPEFHDMMERAGEGGYRDMPDIPTPPMPERPDLQ
ncbi:hypothetical protein BH23VER1_BH23VER1_03010 [soil metagenome]